MVGVITFVVYIAVGLAVFTLISAALVIPLLPLIKGQGDDTDDTEG